MIHLKGPERNDLKKGAYQMINEASEMLIVEDYKASCPCPSC
jgi:hypothetical protein